ncbi:MAG: DNA-binding protein [Sulfolobaceae archaeon]
MSKSSPNEKVINITKNKSVGDYVLDVIAEFNRGFETIILKGFGKEISKTVDVYNSLVDRLKDGIVLENVSTGSEIKDRRRISYILIRIRRVY